MYYTLGILFWFGSRREHQQTAECADQMLFVICLETTRWLKSPANPLFKHMAIKYVDSLDTDVIWTFGTVLVLKGLEIFYYVATLLSSCSQNV